MATDYLNEDDNGLPPSRSQLKRDSEALQDLGRELTELPAAKLKKMELDEQLLVAVLDYQRFSANDAKRRQLQYIGKLMRSIDPAPIEEKLAEERDDLKTRRAKHVIAIGQIDERIKKIDAFIGEELQNETQTQEEA